LVSICQQKEKKEKEKEKRKIYWYLFMRTGATRFFSMIGTTRVNSPLHLICWVLKEIAGPYHAWHLDSHSSFMPPSQPKGVVIPLGPAVIFVTCRLAACLRIYSAMIEKRKKEKKKKNLMIAPIWADDYGHSLYMNTNLMTTLYFRTVLFIYISIWQFNIMLIRSIKR
jgi:hypothetical protein